MRKDFTMPPGNNGLPVHAADQEKIQMATFKHAASAKRGRKRDAAFETHKAAVQAFRTGKTS